MQLNNITFCIEYFFLPSMYSIVEELKYSANSRVLVMEIY